MKKIKKAARRLNWILFRNTVAMLVPAVLVLVLVLAIVVHYPIIYKMTTHSVENLNEISGWYQNNSNNVVIEIPVMKYTGYDYYENGKRTGAYYYAFQENECIFFLIKTKNPDPVLNNTRVRGTILGESANFEAMKNEFAKELERDYDAFNEVVYPLMISEIDYPYMKIMLMWLLLIIPYIMSIMTILLSIYWTIWPDRHPSTRSLKEFGDRRLVYEEIRSQLGKRLVKHHYNYYITDEYLVISNWRTTDFIRIDYIKYISKHVITKMHGRKQVYRLTMSNPEKMFYEHDFKLESCADEIMEALVKLNPMIDNRLIKIFDLDTTSENAKAAESGHPEEHMPEVEQSEAEQLKVEHPEVVRAQRKPLDEQEEAGQPQEKIGRKTVPAAGTTQAVGIEPETEEKSTGTEK